MLEVVGVADDTVGKPLVGTQASFVDVQEDTVVPWHYSSEPKPVALQTR